MSMKTPSCLLNRTPGKNIGIKQKKYKHKKCSQHPCRFDVRKTIHLVLASLVCY